MSVPRIRVLVTRTLIVPTLTVPIAVLVNKDLLGMVHFAKVWERILLSSCTILTAWARGGGALVFHLSLVTAHQKRTQLLMLILATSLKSLFKSNCKIVTVTTNLTFYFVPLTSDIDECSADSSPCDENADCINSDGSYSCTCKQGFTGDGSLCDGLLKHLYTLAKNSTKIAVELYFT